MDNRMSAEEQVELWAAQRKDDNAQAIKNARRAVNSSHGEKWTEDDAELLEALMMKLRRDISNCNLAGTMKEGVAIQNVERTREAEVVSRAVLWANGTKGPLVEIKVS